MEAYMTDIEISKQCAMKDIKSIASRLNIDENDIEL